MLLMTPVNSKDIQCHEKGYTKLIIIILYTRAGEGGQDGGRGTGRGALGRGRLGGGNGEG